MSVYTRITRQQLNEFLSLYLIGEPVCFTGIQEGIENINYAVTTTHGEFILTVYESLTAKQIPCFLLLLNHLCQNNFPAPQAQTCKTGHQLNRLNG